VRPTQKINFLEFTVERFRVLIGMIPPSLPATLFLNDEMRAIRSSDQSCEEILGGQFAVNKGCRRFFLANAACAWPLASGCELTA
jgi:hypothetical protein